MKNLKCFVGICLLLSMVSLISCEKDNAPIPNSPEQTMDAKSSTPTLPYECFDPERAEPFKQCEDNFSPVCACEAITFTSPCEAEKHGFYNYEMGNCVDAACVNEDVRRLFYVTTLYCPVEFPVCGCNGVNYDSQCDALKSGVTSWTPGRCKKILN